MTIENAEPFFAWDVLTWLFVAMFCVPILFDCLCFLFLLKSESNKMPQDGNVEIRGSGNKIETKCARPTKIMENCN